MVGHLPCLSKVPLLTYTQKIAFTNLVLQTWERQGSFSAIRQVFLYKINFMTCLKEKVNKNGQIHQNHPIIQQRKNGAESTKTYQIFGQKIEILEV